MVVCTSAVFGTLAGGSSAFALNSGCRTDPIILLSDGTVIDMSAAIGTSLTDVREVTYTLHAPAGTTLLAAISTPNWPTTVEHFNFYADAAAGQFHTDTIVVTGRHKATVTATTLAGLARGSARGANGQHLQVNLTR